MINKGFTDKQLEQLNSIIREHVAQAQVPTEPGVRQIRFSGSLDSRELVGNIVDGVVHEVVSWPFRILRKIF